MSQQITEAFRQQYADNFLHLSQQMDSRFSSCVRAEPNIVGQSKSVNRLASRTARRRTSRHGDTPINDQEHSTRFLDIYDYEDGDMIDDLDLVRTLINPDSDYVKAMVAAHNRAKDAEIVLALGGNSRSSESGAVVALPATQKIAVGGTGLTKAKIIATKTLFRRNECDEENGDELYMGYHAQGLNDILSDPNITTADQTALQMFQNGTVKGKWMGFTWVPYELFSKPATTRFIYAWAKSGVVLGTGKDIKVRVGEDPGKGFNTRIYTMQATGAVRTEEVKVVEIACNDP